MHLLLMMRHSFHTFHSNYQITMPCSVKSEEQNRSNCSRGPSSWRWEMERNKPIRWRVITKSWRNIRTGRTPEHGEGCHFRQGPGKTSLTFEWDTGISGEGTSWAGEIASSKPLNLERSLSCLRNSKNASVVRQAWTIGEQGGQWGHVTEGFIDRWKDLGFYSEMKNHGEFWAQAGHNLLPLFCREQTVSGTREEDRGQMEKPEL